MSSFVTPSSRDHLRESSAAKLKLASNRQQRQSLRKANQLLPAPMRRLLRELLFRANKKLLQQLSEEAKKQKLSNLHRLLNKILIIEILPKSQHLLHAINNEHLLELQELLQQLSTTNYKLQNQILQLLNQIYEDMKLQQLRSLSKQERSIPEQIDEEMETKPESKERREKMQRPRSTSNSASPKVIQKQQKQIPLEERIENEFTKRKDYLLHLKSNIYNNLIINSDTINFEFKTGNNLSYELPFIITKQELITNIIGRGNTNLDNYKIRTIFSLLSLIKDKEDNDLIDNENNVTKFDDCISTIREGDSNEDIKIDDCLNKYTKFKENDEQISEDSRNSSSKSATWSSSEMKGGNPITNAYLKYHHVFDNKHDFKSKCPKKNDSLCFRSMYNCDAIIAQPPNAKDELNKVCDPMIESKIFLNYINHFTKNDLKDFIYISFFDLNKVNLNVNLFNTMSKTINKEYDTNIQNFMKQFTKTTNPTFFTDGVLSKGPYKNLNKFLENYDKIIPKPQFNKIKNKLKYFYDTDFMKLNTNFNKYINDKQIISLETINDPMATDKALYKKYFIGQKKYLPNIIETFAAITAKMTVSTDDHNIFTHIFCKHNLDFVYYKKKSSVSNKLSFAMRFKKQSFTTFIFNNEGSLNSFNVLYLEKEANSNVYKEVTPNTTTLLANTNIFIGFDLIQYKTYNSNNRISSTINSLVHNLTQKTENITGSYLKKTTNSKEATAFIVLYYLFIINKVSVIKKNFTNTKIIDNPTATEISRVLFDLKKAGDLSKVLFAYYYTEFNDTYTTTPPDDISKGLNEIKDPINGLIREQLIFSSNDTLAVLSGILRNKNDIFFNMQSCYSYFSYRTSDTLKLTLYDIYEKIKLSFGTKFIRNNFDISKSFDALIAKNNMYDKLHEECNKNTKTVILRDKENNNFEKFIDEKIKPIPSDITNYQTLFKLYTLSYFELYFAEFNYNFKIHNFMVKHEMKKYLFNSLSKDDNESIIVNEIIIKYIDKIFAKINELLQTIYLNIITTIKNWSNDVINYFDTYFLKQIKLYQNIIELIEQFLCFNLDETNFFINLANLNKFTSQIVNLYFASSNETKNIPLPKIKKMDDVNMLIVCLSDTEFTSFINSQKNIDNFNADKLIEKLGVYSFVKNLEIFNKIVSNIESLSKDVQFTHTDIKNLFEDFVYEINKLSYFIVIQNIVPLYYKNSQSPSIADIDNADIQATGTNVIANFIITTIKTKIGEAFETAKANKIKPIELKIKPDGRVNHKYKNEITTIENVYNAKKESILKKIDDLLKTKLEPFFENDLLKGLKNDEAAFFYTYPKGFTTDQNNEIKLNYDLREILLTDFGFPPDLSKISLVIPTTDAAKPERIVYQLKRIYNFLISNRKSPTSAVTTPTASPPAAIPATTLVAVPMQTSSGGNKMKKVKKIKKY